MTQCGLTGLDLHDALPEAAAELFAETGEDAVEAALFDVDGLAYLTDMEGYAVTDQALVSLSAWLAKQAAENQASLFRVRGEEFLLLFPGRSHDKVVTIATTLVDECELQRFPYARFDNDRSFLALNAVVTTVDQHDLALMASLDIDVSGFVGRAVYEEKKRCGKEYSVVADVKIDLGPPSARVMSLMRRAIEEKDTEGVGHAVSEAVRIDLPSEVAPGLVELLGLPWHRQHKEVVRVLQLMKHPDAVDALREASLSDYAYRNYDGSYGIGRRCTWALADTGTLAAKEALQSLAQSNNQMIAGYAQQRLDNWENESNRKGLRPKSKNDESTVVPRGHRSGTILTLGILSVFCFPIGIAAWVMANKDLAMMKAGKMDHSGEKLTNTGRFIAMASLFLNALMIGGKLVN